MSILDFMFDNEWSQRADINRLKDQNSNLAAHLEHSRDREFSNEERIAALEREVSELALVAKTLMEVVIQNDLCTAEELAGRIRSASVEQGSEACAVGGPPRYCQDCNHRLPDGISKCLYCGGANE